MLAAEPVTLRRPLRGGSRRFFGALADGNGVACGCARRRAVRLPVACMEAVAPLGQWALWHSSAIHTPQQKKMSLSVDSLLESLSADGGDDLCAARPPSASSGIGSLGSGPTTTCSSGSSRSSSPLDRSSPAPAAAPLRVMYRGRDVLDLGANLLDPRWRLQPTVLPARNLKMYWENRSQYHRLSEFGASEMLRQEECCFPDCSFRTPVPGYDYS